MKTIRGKFLVGCGGRTGFKRKTHLELCGIKLENTFEMSYEEVWVAINRKMTLPPAEWFDMVKEEKFREIVWRYLMRCGLCYC